MPRTAPMMSPSRSLALRLGLAAVLVAFGALLARSGQDRPEPTSWVFLR